MRYRRSRRPNTSNRMCPLPRPAVRCRPDRTRSAASDLAGLQARGAHVEALLVAAGAGRGAHRLNVRVPATAGPAVRVRDLLAEAGTLPADIADGSHSRNSIRIEQASNRRSGDPTTESGYRPRR